MEGAILGLAVIAIGWIVQLVTSWSGSREIKKRFLILYGVGTALLIIDAYIEGLTYTGILNFLILIISMLILIKIGSVRSRDYVSRRAVRRKKR